MKNLRELGFILSVGTAAAFSVAGCGDDTTPTPGGSGTSTTAGTSGTGTAGTGTAGNGTSGTGTGGTGTAGTGTGGAGGKAGAGGGGAGGMSGGSGGAGGGGGKAGAGGSGGSGGSAGSSGSGGGGGSGGGASADCKKWCQGADSVLTVCANNNIPEKINNEQKCLSVCAGAPPASVTCWVTHTANAKAGDKPMHCPHAVGAANQTPANTCPQLP